MRDVVSEIDVSLLSKVFTWELDLFCCLSKSDLIFDFNLPESEKIWNSTHSQFNLTFYQKNQELIIKSEFFNTVELIKSCNVATYNFILSNLNTVSFRNDMQRTNFLGSSSWPNHPEIIGLINIHNINVSIIKKISAIIHESLHSFLYKLENKYPLITEGIKRSEIKLISVWTGRELSLTTYIHATIIWFSIYKFWNSQDRIKNENVEKEIRFCKKGFNEPMYYQQLETLKKYVSPNILEVLLSFKA